MGALVNRKYRRKILLISVILVAALLISFSYYIWCIGCALGYVAGRLTGGKNAGVRGRVKSIILPISKYQLHLHHWFLAVVTLIICIVTGFYVITPQLFYGGMCGLAIQGIFCYDDWFRLIKKKIYPKSLPVKVALEEAQSINFRISPN